MVRGKITRLKGMTQSSSIKLRDPSLKFIFSPSIHARKTKTMLPAALYAKSATLSTMKFGKEEETTKSATAAKRRLERATATAPL